ncbi:glycosyltransferase [Desulfovibrio mangrovi]|uniref:glycosyltransferase family A protein n=1 Tax=Desulfovibrio mangrovi TaxID=2976983 RepID=UPI00224642AC|nr:glycosyltransferase [Desulfovibrio mangrovi]UZP66894.1 glycosyltransferase [Desulfovibrio mangrovi]
MRTQAIIFSKDRALQLRATLDSLLMRCVEPDSLLIRVLYKASDARHEKQYALLRRLFPRVDFVAEVDFRLQLLRLIAETPFVLFLVDDNIFYRDFSLQEVLGFLEAQPEALGFSLRLGRNTTYCHTQDAPQTMPLHEALDKKVLRCRWKGADFDFGYPLEVSSSVYRSGHILALLHDMPFSNPNLLEAGLSRRTSLVEQFGWLLFFEQSVTFCNPLNRVQSIYENRVAADSVDANALAEMFEQGQVVDVALYGDAQPNAAHFEMPLRLRKVTPIQDAGDGSALPFISVIIPVYNGATFLPEAVKSIAAQQYEPVEIIIVNDGSQDDSSAVGRQLAEQYPALRIQVVDKENGGLASARNAGIQRASGQWILPLDCDDCFAEGFLHRAVQAITTRPEINLVFANMQEFGVLDGQWIPRDYSLSELMQRNTFPYASLYRRELWEQAGGYEPSMPWGAEDWLFWLSCSAFGIRPYRVEEPMFLYRTHPEGSMYTNMMKRWDVVKACLRTLQPALFTVPVLLADHSVVAGMDKETKERIAGIYTKYPEAPMPHFWQGLVHEGAGRLAEAVGEYLQAAALAPYPQWQPHFRLCLLNLRLGRKSVALANATEVLARRPELAQLLRGLPDLDQRRLVPLNVL